MKQDLTTIEQKMIAKSKDKINGHLSKICRLMNEGIGTLIFSSHSSHYPIPIYKKVKDDKYIKISPKDIFFSGSLRDALVESAIDRVAKNETEQFIKMVGKLDDPQPNSSSEIDGIVTTVLASHVKKLETLLEEKKQERKYLNNFLQNVYKGSDAKQKAEKELIYLDREIEALKISIPNEDDLPF